MVQADNMAKVNRIENNIGVRNLEEVENLQLKSHSLMYVSGY